VEESIFTPAVLQPGLSSLVACIVTQPRNGTELAGGLYQEVMYQPSCTGPLQADTPPHVDVNSMVYVAPP
jgi:hypothetical protein